VALDPLFQPVEGLGKLRLKLARLGPQGRRRPGSQAHDHAQEGDHDEDHAHAPGNPETLQEVRPARHGEPEKDAQEGDEDEVVRHPEEEQEEDEPAHQRRGPEDVQAPPSGLAGGPGQGGGCHGGGSSKEGAGEKTFQIASAGPARA